MRQIVRIILFIVAVKLDPSVQETSESCPAVQEKSNDLNCGGKYSNLKYIL